MRLEDFSYLPNKDFSELVQVGFSEDPAETARITLNREASGLPIVSRHKSNDSAQC